MPSSIKNWSVDYDKRCTFLFNNDTLSDVKFIVQAPSIDSESGSKRRKIAIPAHKFLLSISSPVFFAMFCGEMAETKDHIDLPDCEYEGMLELLRFIYTDEVCLNGNNVMQVLYLAEKYMIPILTNECAKYLRQNLDTSNVFCILKCAQQYDVKVLLPPCWRLIDKNTEDALQSSEFVEIQRSVLIELVERDEMKIREVELFKAVDCWAKEECKRQQLKADGAIKRQVLGEQIVKNIRFPVMKQSEFVNVVLPSKILTEKETSNIMEYFSSNLSSAVGFPHVHRVGSLLRCCTCTFKSFIHGGLDEYIVYDPDDEDFLPFHIIVDKDIMLHGVSVLGNDGGKFEVTLKILLGDRSILASKTGSFTSEYKECNNGFYYGFDVLFDVPFAVEKNVTYFIQASVDGPDHMLGKETINNIHFSGVTFDFSHQWVVFNTEDGVVTANEFAALLFTVKE
ncbi:BTB/POZ domain-containing protein 6-like [Oculina patagonica]